MLNKIFKNEKEIQNELNFNYYNFLFSSKDGISVLINWQIITKIKLISKMSLKILTKLNFHYKIEDLK